MTSRIIVDDATIYIEEMNSHCRQIFVQMKDATEFSPRTQWTTKYPISLIETLLRVKGSSYLCDEIARDEDPAYVESDLNASLFSYMDKRDLDGKSLLDFGCGSGASTMVMARTVPNCRIFGVDLDDQLLNIARLRASHYNYKNLTFLCSPAVDRIPEEIKKIDFILFSAVYEHLLPLERSSLLLQLWQRLSPNGILFINQTPDRRFPVETHTTGLPLINYFPDSVAHLMVRMFSRRGLALDSWASLLRKGIRGATPNEIMSILLKSSNPPKLLKAYANGISRQSDIWYFSSRKRLAERYRGCKKIIIALASLVASSAIPIAPYISIAVKKGAKNDQSG